MEKEIWKDIVELENKYQISNYGNIRKKVNLKVMSIKNSKGWYLTSRFFINDKFITLRPHRLVAIYFVDNPNSLEIVNHIDMNKQNNYYKNLEWCDMKHNLNEAKKIKPQMVEGIINYNKTRAYKDILQFSKNGDLIRKYKNVNEASLISGVCERNIIHCINNQRNTAGKFIWKVEVMKSEI